ncbi:penicillin-binding transpeptidase domain-containing protein [Halobacillus kuroshimensis]|uniref:penicillin-binding transpeptidase domain-containing protein n=1 Tax=Halobacillus kuroshimensis TaxID=302481 RepID=UPI000424EC13|nr:penicillin-binding transpeptidase domain-containing protein [Halobacillus kuroshimensis]
MKKWMILLVLLTTAALSACSSQPEPRDTFSAYMDAWEKKEYETMYSYLSESSKESITKEDFVSRYEDIYEGIGAEEISITYDLPEEEESYDQEDPPAYEYTASVDSRAGAIEFSHQAGLVYEENEEEGRWAVEWMPDLIFPQMVEGDTVRVTRLDSERGEIFDRDGQGLAVKGPVKEVGIVPGKMEEEEALKEGLADILKLTVEQIDQKLEQSWVKDDVFVPLAMIPEDDEERLTALEDLPAGYMINDGKEARVYPLGEAAAHLTGYMGSITAEELEEREGEGYSTNDNIGKSGLELVMEDQLRGEPGWRVYIADEENETKEVLAEQEAKDGEDVTLTISSDVQTEVYEQLKDESGTAAAIHPETGSVEALVSTPSYNPTALSLGLGGEEVTLNKFSRTYSPGSTFKPITAAVGLETGTINPEEELAISGETYEADAGYSVTRVPGAAADSQVNLRDALVRSDNIYFARQIVDIGGDSFLEDAAGFGFGEDLPFSYPIEASQLMNEDTFESESLLAATAYGQGQVQMSAVHLAAAYTPFITDGTLIKPQLLLNEEEPQAWKEDVVSAETAALIRDDLTAVVQNENGTAYEPVVEGISLAGKTGSAELKKSQDEEGPVNGWFVAWDTEDQGLLVAMMMEDTEEGSHDVVPKVKNVFGNLK